jgi:hypothetical protein
MWEGCFVSFQAHHLDRSGNALVPLVFSNALVPQAKRDVLEYGLPWKQGKLLKHNCAVWAGSDDSPAFDQDGSGCGKFEAGNETQAGCFAAPGGADDCDELFV